MVKRPKQTLPRTLGCLVSCSQLVLVAILFVPGILLVNFLNAPQRSEQIGRATHKLPAKELIKIYSIVKSHRSNIDDAKAWKIAETIVAESHGYGFDPMLVLAIIDVESKFQFAPVSPAGARGMMQILPDVAKAVAEEMGPEKYLGAGQFQPEHLDNPLLNIKLGLYYLYNLKKSFHSLSLALVAYNAGPTEIRNSLENNTEIPHEYASTVLAAYRKYKNVNHPRF